MNAREFFDKVVAMREQQIKWFSRHDYAALNASKALEKEVDAEIARVKSILNNRPQVVQQSLFPDND